MDEGKRSPPSEDSAECFMKNLPPIAELGLAGRATEDNHQGEGSSRGQEHRKLLIESSSSDASRGGEPSAKDDDPEWNLATLGKDDDPEWNLATLACSGIKDADGSGFAGMSASLSSSSSRKMTGQSPRKNSEDKENKKRAKNGEDRPEMPQELKDHITRILGGKDVRLVIEKHLTHSDISDRHCRLSIPENQIIDSEFLREDEKKSLDTFANKHVRVLCYRSPEDALGEKVLKLGLWVMRKKRKGRRAASGKARESLETRTGGEDDTVGNEEARPLKKGKLGGTDGGKGPRPTRMYILKTGWLQFVSDNKLKLHEVVQIWSFRFNSNSANDELGLALSVLPGKQEERVRESPE